MFLFECQLMSVSCLFPGQQAVGVHSQRKGNPSDHRRGERQEAGRQTGQQLNQTLSLTPGFQIKYYLQNTHCSCALSHWRCGELNVTSLLEL